MANFKPLKNERWEPIRSAKSTKGQRYAISTHGRVCSYLDKPQNGTLLKTGTANGYPILSFRIKGTPKTVLVHRIVAEYFCNRPSNAHRYVLHTDHKKTNNNYKNLKWATHEQQVKHIKTDPAVINRRLATSKLSPSDVLKIKTDLNNPKKNITLKQLAKRYKVSDMQIHRIKIGENWGHIKV